MNHRISIYLLLLILFSNPTHSEELERIPTSIKENMTQPYKKINSIESTQGDINGDGLTDIALIVHHTYDNVNLEEIAIFKQVDNNNYSLMASSQPSEENSRRTDNIEIKNKSLYVSNATGSYTDYSCSRYQFKMVNDRFILIGFESSRGVIGEDLPTEKMSINMLTGKIISYNRQDQKETISKLPNKVEVLFSEFFPEGVNLFK